MKTGSKANKKLNKGKDGLSNNKARLNAVQRLNNLETAFTQLAGALQNSFKQIQDDSKQLSENLEQYDQFLMAMVETLSKKMDYKELLADTTEQLKNNRIKALEEQVAANDAAIQVAVAEHKLYAENQESELTSLIVSTQTDKDGNVLHPSKTFLTPGQFTPAVQELLKGKKVGDVIGLPEGGTLTILGLYRNPEGNEATIDEQVKAE